LLSNIYFEGEYCLKTTIPTIIFSMVILCALVINILPFTFASVNTNNNDNVIETQHERSSPINFTIIALPDTQHYTAYYPEIFTNQTQWIVANREALNIVYAAHEGDITDGGTEQEFQRASISMGFLEDPNTTGLPYGIPYTIIQGNHDHDIYHPHDFFNLFFNYTRFEGRPYYGGHYSTNNDNNYALFNASGMDFVAIGLDVWPDFDEIAWANTILQTYPDRRAIVISHDVINSCGEWSPSGHCIYNFLKHNSNLFLILCGHCRYDEGEARRTDVYNGNTIYTLLADYQEYPNGGNGYLRIMTFCPETNQIEVQTYSPYVNLYELDENSQFNLTYYMTSTPPLVCYAGGPYTGETNRPIHFTGTAYGGTPPYTWTWTFGDGGISIDQNPYHIYTSGGVYIVNLTVTDNNSTAANNTTIATITEPPGEPKIVIDEIKGGFGVKAVIKNIGSADATNVSWKIALDGKLVFIGKEKNGTIDIPAGKVLSIKSFVFGFGVTNIKVTADTATKYATGEIYLVLVKI
jgi:PKD repeat protein